MVKHALSRAAGRVSSTRAALFALVGALVAAAAISGNATGSPNRTQEAQASLASGAVAPTMDATHQPARGGAAASLASTPATITDVNMVINGPAWQTESPMANARRNAATAVVGSSLYAITGFNLAPNYTDANERFDGTSWSARAPIPVRHAQGRAAAVGTKIYVPGGFNSIDFGGPLDNMQIYDTATDTWSQGAVLPAARSGVAAVAFNGLVYVIAGYNPVGTGHSDVYIYNPATNTYTTGAPMPAVAGNVPGVLLSGEIYVVGGGTAPGAHYAYNPTTNSWRTHRCAAHDRRHLPERQRLCARWSAVDRRLPGPTACSAGVDLQPGHRQLARRAAVQCRSPGTRQRAVQRSRLRRWRWQCRRWLDGGRVGRNGRPATTSTAATTATATASATAAASGQLQRRGDHDPRLGERDPLSVDLRRLRFCRGRSPISTCRSTVSRIRGRMTSTSCSPARVARTRTCVGRGRFAGHRQRSTSFSTTRPPPSCRTRPRSRPAPGGRPTSSRRRDVFPAPAPAPSGNVNLSVFDGLSANGTWNLYLVDDASGRHGLDHELGAEHHDLGRRHRHHRHLRRLRRRHRHHRRHRVTGRPRRRIRRRSSATPSPIRARTCM